MSNFEGMNNVQIAIIPQGTVINGNIEITGKLEMYGTINGDINSNDRVNICGDVKVHYPLLKNSFPHHDLYKPLQLLLQIVT